MPKPVPPSPILDFAPWKYLWGWEDMKGGRINDAMITNTGHKVIMDKQAVVIDI